MTRTAVLIDERDVKLGKVLVPDSTSVIRHGGAMFVRTTEAIRLTNNGVGMGAVFRMTEVYVRDKLEPV